MTLLDGVAVVVALGFGFLFWWWLFPRSASYVETHDTGGVVYYAQYAPGVAVPLFYGLLLGASLVYLRLKGVTISRPALAGAALILVGSLPFALFAPIPVFFFLFWANLAGMILWYALAVRRLLVLRPTANEADEATGLTGRSWAYLPADGINQSLLVPFSHFGALFAGLGILLKGRQRTRQVVIALVSLLVALPLIAAVVALLVSADQGFAQLVAAIVEALEVINLWSVGWRLTLAIPTAAYIFALAWGNLSQRPSARITRQGLAMTADKVRRLSVAALVAPLAVLCLIYLMFFGAMGRYLFAAFQGVTPDQFTYAEYARRGFFELALVATINLVVLGFAYLFARRTVARQTDGGVASAATPASVSTSGSYPLILRIFGVALAVLTLLLIVTALSRMTLYITVFGLTRLRLYTAVFMVGLAVVFVLLTIWHLRPFRVSGPILAIALVALLGLSWGNTDGLIARHNVELYLSGQTSVIDVDYLRYNLNEAAAPWLERLERRAGDPAVVDSASRALADGRVYGVPARFADQTPWTTWNLQSFIMEQILWR